MKTRILTLVAAGLIGVGTIAVSAQTEPKQTRNEATAPKTVIHVVTVAWKDGTTEAQIKAALDGVLAMPASYKGLTRVWTRSLKVQNQPGARTRLTHAIVMEFASEEAFKAYTDSPAQIEWYKTYQPIREASTTHDVTN